MIKVENLRNETNGFRCDRKSPLGNPFVLLKGQEEVMRDCVVKAYGIYLHEVANNGLEPKEAVQRVQAISRSQLIIAFTKPPDRQSFISYLAKIEIAYTDRNLITLLCWCAPKACHCDRIADYIRWKFLSSQKREEIDENTRYDILFNFGNSTSSGNLEAHIKLYPQLKQNLQEVFADNLKQRNRENKEKFDFGDLWQHT
jgi:hypothetical protein